MKSVAYLRVSKDTQDVKNQRLAILDFAQKEKFEIDRFIELQISSRKSTRERKIDTLLEQLHPGDTSSILWGQEIGLTTLIWHINWDINREMRYSSVG